MANTCPDCGSRSYTLRPTRTAAVCNDCGGYFTLGLPRQEPYASLVHPDGPCLMGCGLCAAY